MALQKQSLSLNFAKGLDTKTDPLQVNPGNFLSLQNSVFTVGGELSKRNGFKQLTTLPANAMATSLATHNGNLVALGNSLYAFNESSVQWQNKGTIPPVSLSTIPMVRTAYTNSAPDLTIAPNGISCVVFLDGDGNYKYQINTASSGESIVGITNLPAGSTLARVFVLGSYFIITFLITTSGTHLQFIAIPWNNPFNPSAATDISTVVSGLTAGYDGIVANNTLYTAVANNTGGVDVAYVTAGLTVSAATTLAGHTATLMSVSSDITSGTPVIWVTAYNATNAFSYALNSTLAVLLPATQTITTETVVEITSTAQNGVLTLFYEVSTSYSYAVLRTDIIRTKTCTQAGTVSAPTTIIRSVGLGSKAFLLNGINYMLASYGGPSTPLSLEPTNFLIDQSGQVLARFASANGSGYATTQVLPSVTVTGNTAFIGYLLKDLIQAITRTDTTSQAGFYTQTGVNLISLNLSQTAQNAVEIGDTLCITGGFLWMYDGIKPVEQGFHLYPEHIGVGVFGTGGSMTANQYYYQVTYEWTDGKGNLHRSTPSIPTGALIGAVTTGSVVLNIPTLRLTYKTSPNVVRIVIYRWSSSQQVYHQVTSVTSPLLNDPSVDSVPYTDTLADASIVGNNILYTTGGVIENLPGPACDVITLFDDRLWLVSAEDRNLLWFSKQVIEATPIEMSDLLTVYVAPTIGAQGSTGTLTAISPMDDKLILFKANALAYLNGVGPDNTGSGSQYSQPIFITSTIGTQVPKSIVFEPHGLIFDTNQGRWLLSRNLGTEYIGAPVSEFNSIASVSSLNVPGLNQVRLTLPSVTLVYNYFYGQWGTFVGIPAISSTLYQGMHTFLNQSGQVYQEDSTSYQDGSEPVVMQFQTGWFNLTGLQGFERAYFFFLLGKYISPHKLYINISYDYNESPSQSLLIQPTNYAPTYGSDAAYGASTPYGGPGNIEWWRVHLQQQKCTAFQVTLQEVYDPTLATIPGAGFTLSGLNVVFGAKGNYPRLSAAQSAS